MTILAEIMESKRTEVAAIDRAAVSNALASAPEPRGFAAALRRAPAPAVIAEFKRASPSKGEIRPSAEPAAIAASYEAAGAAALSVLTDGPFFSGSLADLAAARAATSLPVLRKDFIVHPIQVAEARATGADAVLLIVATLSDEELTALLAEASRLGIDALVEVHEETEAERAVAAGATLVGVNNRDLRPFVTDPVVTKRLAPHLAGRTIVAESGIDSPATIADLSAAGAHAFLIGEALMTAPDPGLRLAELRGAS